MTTVQRTILIAAVALSAAVAHVTLCKWDWGDQYGSLIIGRTAQRLVPAATPGFQVPAPVHYGLSSRADVDKADAVAFGVVLPILLLAGAFCLVAGWRRAARAERGRCLRCGYDLHYDYARGCPECGWRRASKARDQS